MNKRNHPRKSRKPFYEKPALWAWTILVALGLVLALSLIQVT